MGKKPVTYVNGAAPRAPFPRPMFRAPPGADAAFCFGACE